MDEKERVIARRKVHPQMGVSLDWEPDPDAPSVREVVKAMRKARNEMAYFLADYLYEPDEEHPRANGPKEAVQRLDALIARLDGGVT